MKKFLMGLVLALATCVPVLASVNVWVDGVNGGPAQDINFVGASVSRIGPTVQVDTAVYVQSTVAGNLAVTGKTTSGSMVVSGNTTISGNFGVGGDATFAGTATFAGVMIDTALYAKSSGAVVTNLMLVSNEGTFYGNQAGTAVYHKGIYGATAGGGTGKLLWMSADGKIYAP